MIPLWEEGEGPAELLAQLDRCPCVSEILAVGGRGDPSGPLIAPWSKVRRLETERGRAHQMNEGARSATSGLLLFLHADSWLEPASLELVCEVLSRPGPMACAFPLRFREPGLGLALLGWAGRVLSGFNPYALGDQGLAIRRADFFAVGGFAEVPILEDWILVRKLRSLGRLEILHVPYSTSGRRFLRHGIVRQLWNNMRILYRYAEGEELAALAVEYFPPQPAGEP